MIWRAFIRLCAFHWEGMQIAIAERLLASVDRKQRQRKKRRADWERKVKGWPANDANSPEERRALSWR